MGGHDYPKKHLVAGVAADVWYGNEDTIYEPTWFLEENGEHFYCASPKDKWTMNDLKKLSPMDKDYVIWFAHEEYVGINECENLYLAGNRIMSRIEALIAEGLLTFSMHPWKPVGNGHYYAHVMTVAAYEAFTQNLLSQIWSIISTFIRSGEAVLPAYIEDAFHAYNHLYLSAQDKKLKALNNGAYFMATGNDEQLHMEAMLSTIGRGKIFETEEAFMREAQDRLKDLRLP
jgi:hypothetical protein